MKLKKWFRIILIGIFSLLVISGLGLLIWSNTSTYPAREVAQAAMRSTDQVTVSEEDWIEFNPAQKTDTGLIFYPGGLVEPAAYAPVLKELAAEGMLVIITPMPLNLAILDTGAAGAVLEAYPQIKTWILAGHSLGGAAAGIYANNHPQQIQALVLWDSFPPDSADLSAYDLAVLSVYGTSNGFPNTDNFDDKRGLLPSTTAFVAIEGASHAQFGDYGPQTGDVVPTLSLADQHQRVLEIMLAFIQELE